MRRFLAKLTGACTIASAIACLAQSGYSPRQRVYDLPLPRAVAPGEMLAARVTIGPLKAHQRIVVRIRNGEIAGTIAPFGAKARQSSGLYTIPIPEAGISDGGVRLLLQLEQKDAPARAPTPEEVLGITLEYMPATKSRGGY